jgi:hypothetical protein
MGFYLFTKTKEIKMNSEHMTCDNCQWNVLFGDDTYCSAPSKSVIWPIEFQRATEEGECWCDKWVGESTPAIVLYKKDYMKRNRESLSNNFWEGQVGPLNELGMI